MRTIASSLPPFCKVTVADAALPAAEQAELEALIAAEDGSWVERRSGADPLALAAALLAASQERVVA